MLNLIAACTVNSTRSCQMTPTDLHTTRPQTQRRARADPALLKRWGSKYDTTTHSEGREWEGCVPLEATNSLHYDIIG